ncbi:MAG: hypothetical protein ABSA90_19230 [Xanthobacteraceae bacterium]|jgi:putative transcriptional regulator
MSKRAFDKIKAGLDSAKAYLDGTADKRKYRVHVPETIDVRKIRTPLGVGDAGAGGVKPGRNARRERREDK